MFTDRDTNNITIELASLNIGTINIGTQLSAHSRPDQNSCMIQLRDSRLGLQDKPTGCQLNRPLGPGTKTAEVNVVRRQYRIQANRMRAARSGR